MDHENEGDTFVRRVGNHLPSDAATHMKRQESSTTKYSTGATEVQHRHTKNQAGLRKTLKLKKGCPLNRSPFLIKNNISTANVT